MTPRTVWSFASVAGPWLIPLLAVGACSPELHIVASMDPDATAAGMGGAPAEEPQESGQADPTGNCATECCDDNLRDGDETDVDCGGPCGGCGDGQRCTTATDCENKVCTDELCMPATCDDAVLNGAETSRDCGGPFCDGCPVNAPCRVATDCLSGLCDFEMHRCGLSCPAGRDECDGDLSEECETNLLTSAANCGACGASCSLKHATAACSGGTCNIQRCEADFDDCDGDAKNGCETSLVTLDDCGSCGVVCPEVVGATPSCVAGECAYAACDFDYGDCNGKSADGCETVLMNDVENCGRCGRRCENAHGTAECKVGDCVGTCADGWADCNDSMDDGCEADLASAGTCGRCGHACADGEACGEGICYGLPCDGICEGATRVVLEAEAGYRRENIGVGELCVELFGYNVSPVHPAVACWNFAQPRTLEVNGVPMTCDGGAHEFDVPFRAGGRCIHVSAGDYDAAGFEFLGEERPR